MICIWREKADTLVDADGQFDPVKARAAFKKGYGLGPPTRDAQTGGPEFHPEHKMVRFTPKLRRPDHTDPSYHLAAFYELWARWGPKADRPFWAAAAKVSRDYFQKVKNPATALAPNYANNDGTPVPGNGRKNDNFGADAWRTAANWPVDWSWWAAENAIAEVDRQDPVLLRAAGHEFLRERLHVRR